MSSNQRTNNVKIVDNQASDLPHPSSTSTEYSVHSPLEELVIKEDRSLLSDKQYHRTKQVLLKLDQCFMRSDLLGISQFVELFNNLTLEVTSLTTMEARREAEKE